MSKVSQCKECGAPIQVSKSQTWQTNGMLAEAELGEAIPDTVIDAQRDYIKASMRSEDYHNFISRLEEVFALRGVGMLTRFEADDRHVSVTIENSCLHLWMVGIIQGLFELGTGNSDTNREWNLSPEGTLAVTVLA